MSGGQLDVDEIDRTGLDGLSDWLNRIRRHASDQRDRCAVFGEGERLSYGDLEGAVAVLGADLQSCGVQAGAHVVVCMDRSPMAIVAFLAVLRVGGVYLPVDQRQIEAQLPRLQAAAPRAVISTGDLSAALTALNCTIIQVNTLARTYPTATPLADVRIGDSDPACLLFTSGSTGASNGVLISRGALARYAVALENALGIGKSDIYLHSASFAFSASLRQIIAPLTAGGQIAIAPLSALLDPFELLERIGDWRVSVWDTVPSLWALVERALAQSRKKSEPEFITSSLRLIALTGEPLYWEQVAAWRHHLGSKVSIVNLYSQTETVGTVALYLVPTADSPTSGPVPLGEPLPDIELMVLDEERLAVAAGEVGEIYVGSERLAEGYFNADGQTRDAFLPGSELGGQFRRMYRTGDYARLQASGVLIPVGRRDARGKIRGFRVDLQEVEAALRAQPGIDQAVALIEPHNRLVAYVVEDHTGAVTQKSLRRALAGLLPDYAVPARIFTVPSMPVLASGKVDRQALAAQSVADSRPGDESTSGEIDEHLLAIWERTLHYRGARLDDNFFEQGGDSLAAVALFLDIETELGVRLAPATLFDTANLGQLASLVREGGSGEEGGSAVLWRAGGSDQPPLFLVHTIAVHVPHLRKLVELLNQEIPVFALEPIRVTQAIGRQLNVQRLVERYAQEIRRVHPEGPFFLAGWSIGGFLAHCVAVECETQGRPPAALLLLESSSALLRTIIRQQQRNFFDWFTYLRRRARREYEAIKLSPGQQWKRFRWIVQETGRKLHLLPANRASARQQARLHRDFQELVDQHRPGPYHGSVTLFRCDQPAVDPRYNHDLGWSQFVSGNLDVIRLPGDHNSMVIEPQNMKQLAAKMNEVLTASIDSSKQGGESGARNQGRAIDLFLAETEKLCGQPFSEREPWSNIATCDAIRHFAFGIGDDNPLWLNRDHATTTPGGLLHVPPAFLVAARYPVLHGAPVDVPLISLLRDIEYTWERPIREGEVFRSSMMQGEVHNVIDQAGNRKIYVDSHTTYWNDGAELLGRARATLVRTLDQGGFRICSSEPYRYSSDELASIIQSIENESRTGATQLAPADYAVGTRLPSIVRGPLTIGDMVCWHAAVGPSYRPGPLGYKDAMEAPQFRVTHPLTGWPIKYMLQHEDVNLAQQRGMPAPFDNGVMRFAWISPLLTNWMGDRGLLARLKVTINLPFLYGDTCWYAGEVTRVFAEGDYDRVSVSITGTNQRGVVITRGVAEVLLPADRPGNTPAL